MDLLVDGWRSGFDEGIEFREHDMALYTGIDFGFSRRRVVTQLRSRGFDIRGDSRAEKATSSPSTFPDMFRYPGTQVELRGPQDTFKKSFRSGQRLRVIQVYEDFFHQWLCSVGDDAGLAICGVPVGAFRVIG